MRIMVTFGGDVIGKGPWNTGNVLFLDSGTGCTEVFTL